MGTTRFLFLDLCVSRLPNVKFRSARLKPWLYRQEWLLIATDLFPYCPLLTTRLMNGLQRKSRCLRAGNFRFDGAKYPNCKTQQFAQGLPHLNQVEGARRAAASGASGSRQSQPNTLLNSHPVCRRPTYRGAGVVPSVQVGRTSVRNDLDARCRGCSSMPGSTSGRMGPPAAFP